MKPNQRFLVACGVILGLILVSLYCFGAPLAAQTTPGDILANPEKFDGKAVTVAGTMTNLRPTVSRKGNPYYTFDLAAGGERITVFSFGKPPCAQGAAVTVEGIFHRVKRVSGRTFYNQIDAERVVCR